MWLLCISQPCFDDFLSHKLIAKMQLTLYHACNCVTTTTKNFLLSMKKEVNWKTKAYAIVALLNEIVYHIMMPYHNI